MVTQTNTRLIHFHSYTTCILCDNFFRETLDINISTLQNTQSNTNTTNTNRNNTSTTAHNNHAANSNRNNNNNNNNNQARTNQNSSANTSVSMRSYHTMSPASNSASARPTQANHFNNQNQSNRNSRNPDDSNNPDDDNEQRVCYCSMPAALLTVRKEGANQGKQFYGCANNKNCDFFMVRFRKKFFFLIFSLKSF